MPNFIISPYAISWESIRNQLQSYIQTKTEEETWKDFYVSGAGETVIEIAAALGAFYAYHFIVGRRECYLSSAQNYTSIIGLAQNDGYSVARGTNLRINVHYTPSITTSIYKWDIIGSYLEYDIIALETFDGQNELIAGQEVTIPCIIGNLVNGTDAVIVPTERLTSFSFHSDKTSDTFRLILNNNELPVSTEFKDLMNDKWVAISNPYGSVDAFYLQKGKYKYRPNDTLYIQFVEKNDLTWNTFSGSNVYMSIPGEMTTEGCTLLYDTIEQEEKEQIRMRAPLYHETAMVIRSRRDFAKYLLLGCTKLVDANDRDITPGLIEVTYLTKDGSILSELEIQDWLDQMEMARPSGVARAFITHPVQVERPLSVKIWKSDTGTTATLDTEINEILQSYNNKLGIELDLNQIEHDIERLEGVKIARVTTSSGTWIENSNYKLFDVIINANGDTYWVSSLKMRSGSTEPDWPTVIGDTIIDNEILWEMVDEYDGTVWHTWNKNTAYDKYDYIREEILTGTTFGMSGSEIPIWGRPTLKDNRLEWTLLSDEPSGTLKEWEPNVVYYLNDFLHVNDGEDIYYYQCTKCYEYVESYIYRVKEFVGTSGSSQPVWQDTTYDGNIIWRKYENGIVPTSYTTWTKNTKYIVGTNIEVNEDYYTVTSLIGTSGSSQPVWPTYSGAEVEDNDILWTMMDDNNRTLSLAWNQYFKLSRSD